MRVLFYTVNGNGLGHLMRGLAIARRMRRLAPEARFLFATSCEDPGILWRERFGYVKMLAPEAARMLGLDAAGRRRMAERLLRPVFEEFRPHILVVDSFPYGSIGELRPFLDGPWRRVLVSNLFLLQRDLARYRESVRHYGLVVFPFRADEAAGHPALQGLPRPAVFTGPVAGIAADELLPRADARLRLGLPGEGRIVLLAAGGGGGASVGPVLARMAAVPARMPDLGFALLEPPLGRGLPPAAREPNVHVVRQVPIAPWLAAFDAAITAAGMNSAAEMMAAGLPMVWTPLGRPSADQAGNVRRWVARGIGRLPPDDRPQSLAAALRQVLVPETAAAMRAAMAEMGAADGASRAARAIIRFGTGAAVPSGVAEERESDADGDASWR